MVQHDFTITNFEEFIGQTRNLDFIQDWWFPSTKNADFVRNKGDASKENGDACLEAWQKDRTNSPHGYPPPPPLLLLIIIIIINIIIIIIIIIIVFLLLNLCFQEIPKFFGVIERCWEKNRGAVLDINEPVDVYGDIFINMHSIHT